MHFQRAGADDYVGLCVAENTLVWDLVAPRLSAPAAVPDWVGRYGPMVGSVPFRQQLAGFLGRHLFRRPIDPGHLAVLAGAGTVLEILFTVLADPGEGVLVPTPSYAGYWADLETRAALRVVPVHTRPGSVLRPEHLEAALRAADRPVRALLLTNPDNPTGRVLPGDQVDRLVGWARGAGLQVVVNEVYGLSARDGLFPSYGARHAALGDDVHLVWAFSKDLGVSGLRCGVLISESAEVSAAVDALAYWGAVSTDTQLRLGSMVADEPFVTELLREARARLGAAHDQVTALLEAAGVPVVPAQGGLFVLGDLRAHLAAPTWEAEDDLWRRLLQQTGVNLTPGAACRVSEPGYFRICYATEPTPRVIEALRRVVRRLGRG